MKTAPAVVQKKLTGAVQVAAVNRVKDPLTATPVQVAAVNRVKNPLTATPVYQSRYCSLHYMFFSSFPPLVKPFK